MISAPSEIRCRSILKSSMIGKIIATVSGIDKATTAPARNPRLSMLQTMMMAMACQSDTINSPIAFFTTAALAGSEIPWPWSISIRPVTAAPSRTVDGGSWTATRTLKVRVTGSACGSTCRTRPFAVTLGSSVRATITSASPGAVRGT
jgi:hypothetical protein